MFSKSLAALGTAALLATAVPAVPVASAQTGQEDADRGMSMSSQAMADIAPFIALPIALSSIPVMFIDPNACTILHVDIPRCSPH